MLKNVFYLACGILVCVSTIPAEQEAVANYVVGTCLCGTPDANTACEAYPDCDCISTEEPAHCPGAKKEDITAFDTSMSSGTACCVIIIEDVKCGVYTTCGSPTGFCASCQELGAPYDNKITKYLPDTTDCTPGSCGTEV